MVWLIFITFVLSSVMNSDIANAMGKSVKIYISKPFVTSILREAHELGDESTQATCTWANAEIQRAISS